MDCFATKHCHSCALFRFVVFMVPGLVNGLKNGIASIQDEAYTKVNVLDVDHRVNERTFFGLYQTDLNGSSLLFVD